MSDAQQGPDWWIASDGKWYPPQQAPAPPPPGYQPPPPYQPPAQYRPPAATNSTASTSLVLGILSMVLCGPFTGIPAIITGNKAKKEIVASGGGQGGMGMATAGLVLGWISTLLFGLVFLPLMALTFLGTSSSERFDTIDSEIDGTGNGGMNSDPSDGQCNDDRWWQDPDC